MSCDHPDFAAKVDVQRILDSAVWYADVSVKCSACGQQMAFHGFPMGLSPAEPMVDVTGTEARLPFRPYNEEEARRRWLDEEPAGFTVRRGA
jgi:hypothetical protein